MALIARPFRAVLLLAACAACLQAAAAASATAGRRSLLVSGGQAAPVDRFPYTASLRAEAAPEFHYCGAVLVSPRVLATAATCLQLFQLPDQAMGVQAARFPLVRLGAIERVGGSPEIRKVVASAQHINYNSTTMKNDIALLLLDKRAAMRPINLPPMSLRPAVSPGTQLTALGWGDWGRSWVLPSLLQRATLPLQNQTYCKQLLPQFSVFPGITNLCAVGDTGPQGICFRDEGGPLLLEGADAQQDLLVGISSFSGFQRCGLGNPSGFVNVAAYRRWIDNGIQLLLGGTAPKPLMYRVFRKQQRRG